MPKPPLLMTAIAVALLAGTGLDAQAAGFKLASNDFAPNGRLKAAQVFKGFGCEGGNASPELHWSGAPKGTRSFALFVHDPDAPTGGAGWWHWSVVNIPADTKSLPAGAGKADGAGMPAGAQQITTDFGAPGWGGPCPPPGHGSHHYNFTLYALKTDKLELPQGATPALAGFMANANAIGKARLVGRYGRAK